MALWWLMPSTSAYAQREPDGEALVLFAYPSLGQEYVNVVFFEEVPYLPLGEILSLLYIHNEKTESGKGLSGAYPTKNDAWRVDPVQGMITIRGNTEVLPADKFYLGEMDLYLHPEYFSRMFGLNFAVNFHSLTLSLKADFPLPIDERQKREALRRKAQQMGAAREQAAAPLLYGRDRKGFAPGMLDYNVSYTQTESNSNFSTFLNAGMELFGGDLQGIYAGNLIDGELVSRVSGARWRYVFKGGLEPDDNVGITSISVGQLQTTGLTNSTRILGMSVTNNPVIPRMKLDVFVIDGYTEPDSEVELLIGGQLVDFLRADEVGYYRFNAPITFGVVRITTRIYTPQGEVIIQDRQLQIPFTFLPKGFATYNFQAGLPMGDTLNFAQEPIAHADFAYGVTNALTVRAGVDHGAIFGLNKTYPLYGLSARIFEQYLVNVDVLPDRYYQASGSVFYANNTSINGQFTEFVQGTEFNPMGKLREASLNTFFPFKAFGRFSGFRLTGERQWFENGFRTNLQTDFNTQIGRVIARINYRTRINGMEDLGNLPPLPEQSRSMAQATASLTYTLKRTPSVPVFVRGLFLRGQFKYDTYRKQPATVSMMLSQTLFKMGRLTIGYDRDIQRQAGLLQIGFLYDFRGIRTSTQFTKNDIGYVAQQAFTGSLGVDPKGFIIPENRDQVTRSGVAVRLFVDANENGLFDANELVIPAKAVRLDRSANMLLGSDGILRITQLQSYWKYILEVDQHALPNPNLAPKVSRFEFVAEPNRFRTIDIPLYQTGLIEGVVTIEQFGRVEGLGGLRLIVERLDHSGEELQILRTFSDGGFYLFGLMPGKYRAFIDPKQLEFMNVKSEPGELEFEIRALAEGDYLEGLNFRLKPKD
jgi:hypothetical protein